MDRRPWRNYVEPVHGGVVFAHVIETLGRARVIVERDAGTEHIYERRALDRSNNGGTSTAPLGAVAPVF